MTDEKIMATIKPDGEYWQPEIETMPREQLEALQIKKLKASINIALQSPFYKKRLGDAGITADSINSLEDLRKIPFTTKQDLRDNEHDICSWANMIARNLYMVGCRKSDIFQNSSGYGMFTGGLGFQYGAEWLGAMTVPAAAGNTKRQIKFIKDFGTTVLHAIPSYAIYMAEAIKDEGIDPKDLKLHTLCIGAEPHTEEQRRRIERVLNVKAYNSFGMTEMNGPGVAFECKNQVGMHLWEDNYIVEIVDPDTLEPVPDGVMGEMVLTTLDRDMMPILRYRTRDLTRIIPGECSCGRTHRRIDRIKGRTDDMFIIKGVNVFPMQVEKVLVQYPGLGSNYLITLDTIDDSDVMTVEVELEGLDTDIYPDMQNMIKDIQAALKSEILLKPQVKLVKKGSLPMSEGKAVRVKDLRPGRG